MRIKRNPINEGAAKDILELFLRPLVSKYAYNKVNEIAFLEFLFDTENRTIERYEVIKSFVIPGLLYVAGAMKVQGIGYRELSPPTLLWVRKDLKMPNSVDVEFHGGQGGAEHVYNLTQREWNSILPFIFLIDKQ